MAEGVMHGRGHAWQAMCMAGGMHGKGGLNVDVTCMGGGTHG